MKYHISIQYFAKYYIICYTLHIRIHVYHEYAIVGHKNNKPTIWVFLGIINCTKLFKRSIEIVWEIQWNYITVLLSKNVFNSC